MGFEIRIPFSFKRRPASVPEPISRICNFIRILCGTETNTETLKIFWTRGYFEANLLKSGFKVHGKTPTSNFCWTIIKVKIRLELRRGSVRMKWSSTNPLPFERCPSSTPKTLFVVIMFFVCGIVCSLTPD